MMLSERWFNSDRRPYRSSKRESDRSKLNTTSNSDDTKTVSIYAREVLVNFQDMGVGSAASAAIFLMIAVVTAIYVTVFRLNRKLLGV